MATSGIDSFRKFSFNVSLDDAMDQLNEQLHRLLDNTQIHFSKRKKMLLQLERKNNQFRRSIDPSDLGNQKKLTNNADVIRRIKKEIINEEHHQRQRRRDAHEQNHNWSLGGMVGAICVAVVGIIGIATFIIMILNNSKEKYI